MENVECCSVGLEEADRSVLFSTSAGECAPPWQAASGGDVHRQVLLEWYCVLSSVQPVQQCVTSVRTYVAVGRRKRPNCRSDAGSAAGIPSVQLRT